MGSRSLRRKTSRRISNGGLTDENKHPEMISASNAASHGTALERTSIPLSRRAGRPSEDDELSLLAPEDKTGFVSPTEHGVKTQSGGLSRRDRNAVALLIILC